MEPRRLPSVSTVVGRSAFPSVPRAAMLEARLTGDLQHRPSWLACEAARGAGVVVGKHPVRVVLPHPGMDLVERR